MQDLEVRFPVRAGLLRRQVDEIRAVDGVSFSVAPGQTVGLVGESGSGKTTVGRAVLNLTAGAGTATGSVRFDGREILNLPEGEFRPRRKEMQMIFQDPFGSLNPRMRVAEIIGEAYDVHFPHFTGNERLDRTVALLEKVGLSGECLWRYPFEFSGGQRQRIGIARALAVEPRIIVCDEPVSALDVSVQAQIVNLLQDLREELGLAYLFIAHDLAVVEHISDHVLVMYRGKIVESAPSARIYADPQNDYTRKLLAAVPTLP